MPVNSASIDVGTALSHGLSIYTAGGSAVSAYGPTVGRNVAVVVLTVPSITASGVISINTSFPVTGAAVGDIVTIGAPSSLSAGVIAFGFVSAANEVTLTLVASAGTAVQTAQTWNVGLYRRSFITSIR